MKPRAAAWAARSASAFGLTLAALGLVLAALGLEEPLGVPVFSHWVEDAVIAVGFSAVGAVVAHRFPSRNPIGWLFCAIGLLTGAILFVTEYAYYSALASSGPLPGPLPGGGAAAWFAFWLWVPQAGLFAFLALLFPDGRLPSPRWRPFAYLVAAAVALGALAESFSPAMLGGIGADYHRGLATIPNPLGFGGLPNPYGVVEATTYSLTLVAALSLFARVRRADGVERQQIKWFAYAGAVAALGALILYVLSDWVEVWWLPRGLGLALTVAGLAGLPVALAVAVLKYRLHDIDLIISGTLVYGTLTAVLAGVFEVGVVALQEVLLALTGVEDSRLAYFATAMAMAVLFEPLKRRIDALVERLFFRQGDDDGGPPEEGPAEDKKAGRAAAGDGGLQAGGREGN
jgi:hypothetical protein